MTCGVEPHVGRGINEWALGPVCEGLTWLWVRRETIEPFGDEFWGFGWEGHRRMDGPIRRGAPGMSAMRHEAFDSRMAVQAASWFWQFVVSVLELAAP